MIITKPFHAGYLQFDVIHGEPEKNLTTVRNCLSEFQPGPGIVVLPELWATGFAYGKLAEFAVKTPSILADIREICSDVDLLIAGSLLEEKEGRFFNTLFITGPDGVLGSYRKQRLFAPMDEDKHFTPGMNPEPVVTPLGLIGGLVCYDLRFPELSRRQSALGAGVLIISAQWPLVRKEHWRTLVQARAIENQLYVIACNRCGNTGGTEFAGHSMIVAPDGEIINEARREEAIANAMIDPEKLELARSRFNTVGTAPYLANDIKKHVSLGELKEIIARYKLIGRKVVFTNGCFDILHQGHVSYLEAARCAGDCLIIGLNSDSSVRSIKGPERPINDEKSRARVLAALGCVDHVVLFDEDTPLKVIKELLPDVLVKGADWPIEEIVGSKEVLESGGEVKTIPVVEGFSTTNVISRIQENDTNERDR